LDTAATTASSVIPTLIPGNQVRGITTAVTCLRNAIPTNLESGTKNFEKEIGVLDATTNLLQDIRLSDTTTSDDLSNWISKLNDVRVSSSSANIIPKRDEFVQHLSKLKTDLKLIPSESEKTTMLRKSLFAECIAARDFINQAEKQSIDKMTAKASIVESAVKIHEKKLDAAETRLAADTLRLDENLKAMNQKKDEMNEMLISMTKLDTSKTDLEGDIECLKNGLNYLSQVEKQWRKLTIFFDTMNQGVVNSLNRSLKNFNDSLQDNSDLDRLTKPALVASGMCLQVCNCASIYTDVSQKFVVHEISDITSLLGISNEQAIAMKNTISLQHETRLNEVREFIDKKRKEHMERFETKIRDQHQRLHQASITQ
jgi:hypothetical protein